MWRINFWGFSANICTRRKLIARKFSVANGWIHGVLLHFHKSTNSDSAMYSYKLQERKPSVNRTTSNAVRASKFDNSAAVGWCGRGATHPNKVCGFVSVKCCARCPHFNTLMRCILAMPFMPECAYECCSILNTAYQFGRFVFHNFLWATTIHRPKHAVAQMQSSQILFTKFLRRTSVHLERMMKAKHFLET